MNILLEGVPDGVDIALVEKSLLSLPGVDSIHDLHVWAITTGKPSLSVHMVSTTGDFDRLAIDAAEVLESEFNIHHSTVQMERNPCEQAAGAHKFS